MSTSVKTRRIQESKRRSSRRLFIEGLENRSVLAGDVMALAVGGHLMIHGDGDANGVHIQTMSDGTVQVSGMEAGGSPTTINGSSDPFVAANALFMTRVNLGNGDDVLQIDSQASTSTDTGGGSTGNTDTSGGSTTGNMPNLANLSQSIRDRLSSVLSGLGGGVHHNLHAQEHLLINTGNGHDTVKAEVGDDVDVHLLGNLRGDNISIQTMTNDDAGLGGDTSSDPGAGTSSGSSATGSTNSTSGTNVDSRLNANANLAANAAANLASNLGANNLAANLGANAGLNTPANVDPNTATAINSALNTDLNSAIDAIASAAAGGISTNANLDSNLIANLASNAALNSSANLGTSSLLNNTDTNLNGAVGGSAALNIAGDSVFDEIGMFNLASLANLNAQAAANAAIANANAFGLSQNAVDAFFASQQANARADTSLLGTLTFNDQMGNGSLNTNIFSGLNSGFQAREGLVPMG